MSRFYVFRNGRKSGPFSSQQLRGFAQQGLIKPDDDILREDMQRPIKAKKVAGLFDKKPEEEMVSFQSLEDSGNGSSDDTGQLADAVASVEEEYDDSGYETQAASQAVRGRTRHASRRTSQPNDMMADVAQAIKSTASVFFTRPISTITAICILLTGSLILLFGILTIVLIPLLVMGYVAFIDRLIENDPDASIADFISFMRSGWDSLWHLLMLFMSYLVTIAVLLLVVLALFVAMTTIFDLLASFTQDTGIGEQYPSSFQFSNRQFGTPPQAPSFFDSYSIVNNDFLLWMSEQVGKVGGVTKLVYDSLIKHIIGFIFNVPINILFLLWFYMAFTTVKGRDKYTGNDRFNLVYESFQTSIKCMSQRFPAFLMFSLIIASVYFLVQFFVEVLAIMFAYFEWYSMSIWISSRLYIVGIVLVVISTTFSAAAVASMHKGMLSSADVED